VGERVTLQNPYGYYKVVKVQHYPTPEGRAHKSEGTVALRLLLIDDKEPVWDPGL
jgi:hypothetical protein